MISFISFKCKSFKLEMDQFEKRIKETETDFFKNPSQQLFIELNELKAKYNVLSMNKATKGLMILRQSYYEQGEKASKLLAWRINQLEAERAINSIQTDKGVVTTDPKEINESFYPNLNRSDYSASALQKQNEFLDLDFAPLNKDSQASLELELKAEELSEAICILKGRGLPGLMESQLKYIKLSRLN